MSSSSERIEVVGRVVRGYGGTVHGDTLTGEIDVAFPDVHSATSFRDIAPEVLGCVSADLRKGDAITDLDAPVVLTLVWTVLDTQGNSGEHFAMLCLTGTGKWWQTATLGARDVAEWRANPEHARRERDGLIMFKVEL